MIEAFQNCSHWGSNAKSLQHKKWQNKKPQGIPEALDRFSGKVMEFYTTSQHRQRLKPSKIVYMSLRFKCQIDNTQKPAECRATGCHKSSRWILWKRHGSLYNSEASTRIKWLEHENGPILSHRVAPWYISCGFVAWRRKGLIRCAHANWSSTKNVSSSPFGSSFYM